MSATLGEARAERALSQRHKKAWPRDALTTDHDEAGLIGSGYILLEKPAGRAVLNAEYKAVEAGPLDLNGFQFRTVHEAVTPHLPLFAVQFTHPLLNPPQPWAFYLHPLNDIAREYGSVIFSEQAYVQWMYVLQRGLDGAGGGYDPTEDGGLSPWVEPWKELAHLDNELPGLDIWPPVTPAKRRELVYPTMDRRGVSFQEAAKFFIQALGHPMDGAGELAEVVPLVPDRPALGAFKTERPSVHTPVLGAFRTEQPRVRSPHDFKVTKEVLDRHDRTRYHLDRAYREMWGGERASQDSRDAYLLGGWRSLAER